MRLAEGTVWNQWRPLKLGWPQPSARSSPTNPSAPKSPLWCAHCGAPVVTQTWGKGNAAAPQEQHVHPDPSLATSTREEKPSLVKVSSLHTNLHVSFLQRRERVFHRHQARVKAAACPRSPVADDPSALPPPTCSPSSSQELLLCPLDASLCSPAVVLYYCALRDTILKDFKYFLYFLCLLVFYVLFVWKVL